MTMPELAVKWALAADGVASVLVGSRNVEELEANVRAAEDPLDAEIVGQLNDATEELKQTFGRHFDYYQGVDDDRTG